MAAVVACLSCGSDNEPTGVTLARQWTGVTFAAPMYLTQAPGDDTQWYVVERQGKVRVFPDNATSNAQIRDFASVAVNAAGEGGLLGMAFHPEWPAKREAYLSYTRNIVAGDPAPPICAGATNPFTSVVARFQSTNQGMSLDSPADEIIKVGQPFSNHNGGHLQFGLDDMLYFGLGDGGSGNDPCGSGQDLGSLLGKILRIDVNAPAGTYNVPFDNPFAGTPAASPEIWSYGHRNPWRWSFDKASGELWVGDVGQGAWEEIDRVVKGGNYGWNPCEGFHKLGSTTALCNTPGLLDPVVEHPRSEAQSITGGYVYRGSAMPSLVGTYIYGDFATGNIWALTYDADNKPTPKLISTVAADTLVSFAQGNDGEVYTVQVSGTISKLVPCAPPPPDDVPQPLPETGCVDPDDPTGPAAGPIP
jgi:glucose/arabinose dehydrogenase